MRALLPIEFLAGTHIDEAAHEAKRLAEALGVTTQFDFNEVKCGFRPGDDVALFIENYHRVQAKPMGSIKICYANPLP